MTRKARNTATSTTTINVPLLARPPVRPLLPINSSLEPEVVGKDGTAPFTIPNIHYIDKLIDILESLSMTKADCSQTVNTFTFTSEGLDVALSSYGFFHQTIGHRMFGSGFRAAFVWLEDAEGVPRLYALR